MVRTTIIACFLSGGVKKFGLSARCFFVGMLPAECLIKEQAVVSGSNDTAGDGNQKGSRDHPWKQDHRDQQDELSRCRHLAGPSCPHIAKRSPGSDYRGIAGGNTNGQIAGNHCRYPPDGEFAGHDKGEQGRDHEHLVGNGIQQASLPACHLPAPGAPAVKKISGPAAQDDPDPQFLRRERKEQGQAQSQG